MNSLKYVETVGSVGAFEFGNFLFFFFVFFFLFFLPIFDFSCNTKLERVSVQTTRLIRRYFRPFLIIYMSGRKGKNKRYTVKSCVSMVTTDVMKCVNNKTLGVVLL